MPPATFDAFRDHGRVRGTLEAGIGEAQRVLDDLARTGISLDGVTNELTQEGVRLFADAADKLLGALARKNAPRCWLLASTGKRWHLTANSKAR
jgi:transaldolase/glucose-6-phosphate isomerase